MNDTIKPALAISDSFFTVYGTLPRPVQKKLLAFMGKFRQNPDAPGLNYERIQNAASVGYRSARIDKNYRTVICHPEKGDVYFLLWAGKHEEAYRWARTHVCQINPVTGGMQFFELPGTVDAPVTADSLADASAKGKDGPAADAKGAPSKETGKDKAGETKAAPLFAAFSDDELLSVGVPQACLALVRGIAGRDELDRKGAGLPPDALESLAWLADGEPLETVIEAYGGLQATDDPVKALENERSRRSFKVIETDEEMMAVVNASLERWRVFLHPAQRKLVERTTTGPMVVRGAAGTGKTVVAMHRAVNLVRRADWAPGERLLFTTYTKNLAIDISEQLNLLCTPEEKRRIEVINLDAWLDRFLKQNQVTRRITYPGRPDYAECWSSALTMEDISLGLPESFYSEEWRRTVLAGEVKTEQEYLRALRKGRGTPLTRKQRKAVWPVFDEMRQQLANAGLMTVEDACFQALHLLAKEKGVTRYRAVIVDEAQDFGNEALRLLARLALPEGDETKEPCILLTGDGQQRIYARQGSLASCGINVRGRRSARLKLTYRTTEEIREAADQVLAGVAFDDMDEGVETLAGNLSNRHGEKPEVFVAATLEEECRWIADRVADLKASLGLEPADICVVTRKSVLLDQYEAGLQGLGLSTTRISRNKSDSADPKGRESLRLATMHRVKGLEFRAVFIAGASEGQIPFTGIETEDKAEIAINDKTERSLFYVAASRAKDALFVSCCGEPGAFLKLLEA